MYKKYLVLAFVIISIFLFQSQVIWGANIEEDDLNIGTDKNFDTVFKVDMPTSTTILKDSDGFIWLPTQNGLVRFDGYETLIYKTGDNSISNDYITSIIEDSKGYIWIGTQGGGLDRYDKEHNEFYNYRFVEGDNSLGSNTISINAQSIMEDSHGNIWIATQETGLSVLNPYLETFTHYSYDENNENSLSSNQIWSIFEDEDGYIWAGAMNGLNKLDPMTGEVIRFISNGETPDGIGPGWVYRIIQDTLDSDILWIGTVGSGLHRFNKKTLIFEHFPYPDGNSGDQIITMAQIGDDEIWIGWYTSLRGDGLAIFDKESGKYKSYYNKPNDERSIGSKQVFAIENDDQGVTWIVNSNGLVQKYDPSASNFSYYQHAHDDDSSISDNGLMAYYEDRKGTMWFGSVNSGFMKYDKVNDAFTTYSLKDSEKNGVSSDSITRIYEDSAGSLYVAGRGGQLMVFDREIEKVTKVYTHDPLKKDSLGEIDSIRSIVEDKDNKNILYMGSFLGGFHIFDKEDETFTNFVPEPKIEGALHSNSIMFVHQDPYSGEIWLASSGGGLIKFDRESRSFTALSNDPHNSNSLGSNNIWEIKQYDEENLWIATVGGGLNKLTIASGEIKRFNIDSGFPANTIVSIVRDDDGYLWLGTDVGLVRFDIANELTKVYTKMDGLLGDVFLDTAAWKSSDGTMWFGGVNGPNRFDPIDMVENQTIPPIVLTSLTQSGIPIETKKALSRLESLTLNGKENYFEFTFAALNYSRTEKNQYAYMLEGVDDDWYYAGDKRFGRYSSLKPGNYVLRLKGSNNNGYWNEEGVSINIKIVPPFYKTKTFLLLSIILGIGLLLSIYFIRIQRMNKQKIELKQLVEIRTKELEEKSEEEAAMNEELTSLNEELLALNTELHDSNDRLIEMQNMLVQTEKMTAMGNLVAGLAHEINTPIGVGITASSNLAEIADEFIIKMSLKEFTEEERVEYLEDIGESAVIIQKNIERAGRLIRNFKLVSTDQSNSSVRTFTINDYLQEIMMTLRPMMSHNKIGIKVECDAYLEVECDPGNLSQIVTNLVQNAIHHGYLDGDKGLITIKVQADDENISMSIIDDGLGMDEDTLMKIFDPFYTTKRGQGGTGLGLYIVYNIVSQQMHGSIRCISTINKGTEFIIQWPRIWESDNE